MSSINDRLPILQKQLKQIVGDLGEALQSPFQTGFAADHLRQLNDENLTDAKAVVGTIEAEHGLDLDAFNGFHKRLSESVNETLSYITDSLDTLRLKIEDLLELKSSLEEVSYSIKNISLLMKIKTTKMGKSEFDHVVKGLERLAGQVKENTEGITVSASEATENIRQASEEINERLDRFNRLFKPSRKLMEELGEMVAEMSEDMLKQVKRIETLYDQTEQSIENLKSSESSRPCYRDHMEESRKDLQEVLSLLDREDIPAEDLKTVADALSGKIDQLTQWEIELESVEDHLAKNLSHLIILIREQDTVVNDLSEKFLRLKEKISSFEREFSGISSTFAFSDEKTHDFLDAISAINEHVTRISGQVSQIDIGRTDLEALTYNAVFKAAKVGMQGKVMEAITDEITGLSRDMQSRVTDKEAVIKSILDTSKEFKSSLSERLNQQLDFSNEMNLRIREECQRFYREIEVVASLPQKTARLDEAVSRFRDAGGSGQNMAGLMQKLQMGLADILHELRDMA